MSSHSVKLRGVSRQEVPRIALWAAFLVALLILALVSPGLIQEQQQYLWAQHAASVNVLPGAPAPSLPLMDVRGHRFSLSEVRGRAVLLAFVDVRGSASDSVLAREIRQTLLDAGGLRSKLAFVLVNVNAALAQAPDARRFAVRHRLFSYPNVYLLTGSPSALQAAWRSYGIYVSEGRAGISHTTVVYILDGDGRERYMMDTSDNPDVILGYARLFLHYMLLVQKE